MSSEQAEVAGRQLEIQITDADANARLDKLLLQHVPELGRRGASELFRLGQVRVAGRIAKKGELARPGLALTVQLPPPALPLPDASAPLDVRLERSDLVIVNKPAGQPTVPVPGSTEGTLASALLGRYPEMAGIGYSEREPGLLHRLDTGTSGLLLAARSSEVFEALRARLRGGRLEKRYLALVAAADLPGSGVIDDPLGPEPRDSRRMRVAPPHDRSARVAVTEWNVSQRGARYALLEVHVQRALRHQIRVHLASIGHPIVGDTLYGGPEAPGLVRHALHASYIGWEGDATVPAFAVEQPLPEDMARLMAL